MNPRLTGLIAATYTPLNQNGTLKLEAIPQMVDHLEKSGLQGIYIGGTTGEGVSLTGSERRELAEAYVSAAKGRLRTIVQVGHNSLVEARELASHAQEIGADVISAVAPSYYKITSVEGMVAAMEAVAIGAPELPFYYYHIPAFTGTAIDTVELLKLAGSRIPNLRGIKYTAPLVHEFQACQAVNDGSFDVVWGTDEMLLSALVVGAQGAIGSTYNIAAPLYLAIMEAYRKSDMQEAARLQLIAVQLVRLLLKYPFHSAVKCILGLRGIECGPCRLPQESLTAEEASRLKAELEATGFDRLLLGTEGLRFDSFQTNSNHSKSIPKPHSLRFASK